MRHASLIVRKRDHFPWITLLLVFLLQALIGITFAVRDRNNQVAKASEDMQANTQILESMLLPNLHRSNYEAIVPMLDQWVALYKPGLVSVELTSANDFSFYQYFRPEGSRHTLEDGRYLPYSYQGKAHLHVVWDLNRQHLVLRNDLLVVGLISLITLASLFLMLNLARQRQRHIEELAAEKELLDVTLRQLADGVIMTDTRMRIVLINLAAEQLIGLVQGTGVDQPIDKVLDLMDEMSNEPLHCNDISLTSHETTSKDNLILYRADGGQRHVRMSCSTTRDRQGKPLGLVVILNDLTKTRQLEFERRQNTTLQAVGLLAGGIAHDFNNMLTAISGNIQMAKDLSPGTGEVAELLSAAEHAAVRSAGLTQQLLTFSRGGDPVRENVDLGSLIREVGGFVLRGTQVTLKEDLPPDLWPVFADRSQLAQVIQNLVINARQAMTEEGVITVTGANIHDETAAGERGFVRIEFIDSGPGIRPADLEKIFNPYFTTKGEGSGLGLGVAHSIITRHQGKIEASSPEGEGAVFTLLLPAGRRVAETEATEFITPTVGRGRILIMDDDPAVLHATCKMTEKLGYETVACANGEKALQLYQTGLDEGEPIDVVLLDLTIKEGMGGQDTCTALKLLDPNCRTIVVSGYSDDSILANHQEFGFMFALPKPFLIEDLASFLAKALQQNPS